jgi:hypothetical protein
MLIANWSSTLAADSNKRFRDLGLSVVRSNSMGVPRNDAPYVIGNMQGLWNKMPWLVDTYYKGSVGFSYLSLIPSAEFAWNVDPRLDGRGLDRALLDERAESVLRRIALQPSPSEGAAQTPLDLSAVADLHADGSGDPAIDLSPLPQGEASAARTRLTLPADRKVVALTQPGHEVAIPLNAPAAEVRLLITCHIAEGDVEAFSKQFRRRESITCSRGTAPRLPHTSWAVWGPLPRRTTAYGPSWFNG